MLPLGLMAVFFFYPVGSALYMSLLDYSHNIVEPSFIGLQNYQTLFSSGDFWNASVNTVIFMLGVVPAMATIPILLALALNTPLKGIGLFRLLIYLPVVVSMVVVGIAWKWLYAKEGLINIVLQKLGLGSVDWLVNPDIALIAVMIVVVWKGLAYYMMMYLAQLQSVNKTLYESAQIDGASALKTHWHITLPHLKPTILLVMVISTIGSLKTFTEIYVMTKGGPIGATETLVYFIYKRAFENLDLGIACAAGLVLMVVLLALSAAQLKLFKTDDDLPKPARLKKASS